MMTDPEPRQPEALKWFQVGCLIGCTCAGKGKEMYPTFSKLGGKSSVGCDAPMEPTNNDAKYRTFNLQNKSVAGDWTRYFPWRAPGFSKPLDACSIASGFREGENSYGSSVSGFTNGAKGSSVAGKVTYWPAGGTAEARYGIMVNHGGGYQYRLCPKTQTLTEECFQANPLKFASGDQFIEKADGSRVKISVVDLSEGTSPPGSAWRRFPLPACNCDIGVGCVDRASASRCAWG
jgi:hypothetical protein